MTLTVQDDSGTVADANGYITVLEFQAYHGHRANDVSAYDEDAIAAAIVRASGYLDTRFRFKGRRLNLRDQSTEWPRANCYDSDRAYVLGVPKEVKDATAEYALRALTAALAPDPEYSTNGAQVQSKSEKVGPIEESTTYVQGSSFQLPKYPAADLLLTRAGLTESGGNVRRG